MVHSAVSSCHLTISLLKTLSLSLSLCELALYDNSSIVHEAAEISKVNKFLNPYLVCFQQRSNGIAC